MSSDRYIPIKMGMLGMSIEDIDQGKQGFVKLPLGPRDLTMEGGREWVKVKVTALEAVRANRDIIVANEQGEVKEHTPVELSYEKTEGGYQRVGAENPLPVTMSARALTWVNINKTDGSTTIMATPATAKKIRVHYVVISNNQAAVASVGISFKSAPVAAADFALRLYVPADGGTVALNLTDANVQGDAAASLYAYCAAAYGNGVYFNVGYDEV